MIKAGFHWRLRSPKWSRKSPYDSVKIKNRSCKLNQKNKNVSISLRLHCLRPSENQIDGVKSGTLDKPTTMHVPTLLCDWFSSSASACDSNNLVFT